MPKSKCSSDMSSDDTSVFLPLLWGWGTGEGETKERGIRCKFNGLGEWLTNRDVGTIQTC